MLRKPFLSAVTFSIVTACSVVVAPSYAGWFGHAPAKPSSEDSAVDPATKAKVAAKLSSTFKNFTYDDIKKSELPGIYEVYTGGHIIYFAPDQGILVFGELYRTDGHSLTAEKIALLQGERAVDIDKSAAIVIGDGPIEVMSFVDPDCGYCRASHQWMQEQQLDKNVKQLVFFMPMTGRPKAQAWAENVICAPPEMKQAAYDALWLKKPVDDSALLKCDGAEKQLADQAREARKFGVQGTPTFVVNGQVIAGFKRDELETLLTKQGVTQ